MKKHIVAFILCLAYAAGLVGCAGTAADTDFRSKVQSDTTTITGDYDPITKGAEGGVSNTMTFRDPAK